MRLEELVLISTGALLLFIPLLVGVLILRRAVRGEDFKDQDWRFLFGRPKDEVLDATFWSKMGLGSIICFAVAFIEYYLVAPYGSQWFVVIIVLTILGIAIYAPRFLR